MSWVRWLASPPASWDWSGRGFEPGPGLTVPNSETSRPERVEATYLRSNLLRVELASSRSVRCYSAQLPEVLHGAAQSQVRREASSLSPPARNGTVTTGGPSSLSAAWYCHFPG